MSPTVSRDAINGRRQWQWWRWRPRRNGHGTDTKPAAPKETTDEAGGGQWRRGGRSRGWLPRPKARSTALPHASAGRHFPHRVRPTTRHTRVRAPPHPPSPLSFSSLPPCTTHNTHPRPAARLSPSLGWGCRRRGCRRRGRRRYRWLRRQRRPNSASSPLL